MPKGLVRIATPTHPQLAEFEIVNGDSTLKGILEQAGKLAVEELESSLSDNEIRKGWQVTVIVTGEAW